MLSNRFLTLPDPFDLMARRMDEMLGGAADGGMPEAAALAAPAALWEDDGHVYLEVEVPGLRQEDLDLTVEDGRLTIAGERKPAERAGECWFDERRYGRFERVIALSGLIDPDSIEAELRDGVLSLTLRKKPEAQPQRIAIRTDGAPRLEGNSRPEEEQRRLESGEAEAQPAAGSESSGRGRRKRRSADR